MRTIEEQLKKLAREFLQAELWEALTDADVFGVELEDGRIAYCCVMGSSGIHKGLGIYVGNRGFRSYLDTINKEHANDRKMPTGWQRSRPCRCRSMIMATCSGGAIIRIWCQARRTLRRRK